MQEGSDTQPPQQPTKAIEHVQKLEHQQHTGRVQTASGPVWLRSPTLDTVTPSRVGCPPPRWLQGRSAFSLPARGPVEGSRSKSLHLAWPQWWEELTAFKG